VKASAFRRWPSNGGLQPHLEPPVLRVAAIDPLVMDAELRKAYWNCPAEEAAADLILRIHEPEDRAGLLLKLNKKSKEIVKFS